MDGQVSVVQAGSANSGTLRAEAMEGTLLSNVTISPRRSQRLAEKVGLGGEGCGGEAELN